MLTNTGSGHRYLEGTILRHPTVLLPSVPLSIEFVTNIRSEHGYLEGTILNGYHFNAS